MDLLNKCANKAKEELEKSEFPINSENKSLFSFFVMQRYTEGIQIMLKKG